MNNFDTLFPNFLNQCTEMNHVLTPIAFVLLAIGIVSSTVTGQRSPSAYLRTIGRTLVFAAVLAYLPSWSNEIATTVDSTVRDTLHADPAGVAATSVMVGLTMPLTGAVVVAASLFAGWRNILPKGSRDGG